MSEWQSYKIDEIAILTQGLAINAKTKHLLVEYSEYPLLRIKDLLENTKEQFVDPKLVPEQCIVKPHDLIMSRTGQVGFVFINREGVLHNNLFKINIKDNKILDVKFLYWHFNRKERREYLTNIATGSVQPDLSHKVFKDYEILLPPLPEQKAIADVLSSLDDKIDLLHRQNKTLESMAEILFRQWFVEEAQDDWDVYSLEEVSTISIGRTPPRKNKHLFSSDINDVKWLSIKDMGKSGIYRMYTEEFLPKSTIESFKIPIIPTNTVVLSFKMTVGRVGITHEEMVSNEAIAQFNIKKIISTEFLYCFLKQYNYDSLGTTSSIVTSINTGLIKSIQFSIPNDTKVAEFTQRTKPFFEKVKKNQMEIQTLEKLRDTLLPKLMSGEVRVNYTPEEIKQ
ncbi:TPA: restriction endonuclease subunit S [Providencia rettgeri]